MKRTLLALALLYSANSFAWGNWIDEPYDKVAHAGVGLAISAGGYASLHHGQGWKKGSARWTAFGMAAGLGLLKEISDENFDPADLAATVGGATLGLGLTFTF